MSSLSYYFLEINYIKKTKFKITVYREVYESLYFILFINYFVFDLAAYFITDWVIFQNAVRNTNDMVKKIKTEIPEKKTVSFFVEFMI